MSRSKTWQVLSAIAGFAVVSLAAGGSVRAQTAINVGTGGSGSASWDPYSGSGGPFPFSNFGVATSANLGGTNVNVNLGGMTSFLLPQFSTGQVLAPGGTGGAVGYTPNWTGSVAASSTLSANATFVYNLGPFSGSDNIFSQNLSNPLSGNLAASGGLVGGSSSNTASSTLFNFGLSANALLASASATIDAGVQYQSSLAWNPTTTYGVNSWISSAPVGAALTGTATSSVSSGGLNYELPSGAGLSTNEQYYLNLQPVVNLNMSVDPSATVSAPISGNLNVQAFGDTIVNYNFPIANLFSLPINYDPWNISGTWDSSSVLSVPVEYAEVQGGLGGCPIGAICSDFVVDKPIELGSLPPLGGGINNLNGGSVNGNWNPVLGSGGLVPQICDPVHNTCYASNDPNLPVGPGTVMTSDTPVGTPEPGETGLLVCGVMAIFWYGAWRRKLGVNRYAPALS